MPPESRRLVLCAGARTPIGHIARSLSPLKPEILLRQAVEATVQRARLPKEAVDGLIAGWVGQTFSAPNIARVALLNCGLPEKAQAVTVQNNCVSSIEAIASAARRIQSGEGRLYLAGGTESMSRLPYSIDGSRAAKPLRSLQTVKEKWAELPSQQDVAVIDSMEEGLTDPVKRINMAGTAEVCAQMYDVPRQEQDDYARESFRRALEAWRAGFYGSHVVAAAAADGSALLTQDEYPFLREDLVRKPQMLGKAPALFDNSAYPIRQFYRDYGRFIEGRSADAAKAGSVTLFNSCGRSDGAAAIVVAEESRARELGLEILGELRGWAFYGNNPAHMGVAPALAAPVALERAGLRFSELDSIELHEPFAATVLSIFKVGKERFGHDWRAKYEEGALNPHGGSIALGHPLGATGARLMLNLLYALKSKGGRHGMIAACAGGGMGGAMVVSRP
ncbi:MAG: thiolase family protein [Elusimicrobia bacterium]|nr:thiolase family protein [Elusimicrobiota bacterium]MDE2236447.1 thiolase family protein [Elusimicrobiota bacterium]MDE2426719.1 thiolase family protein [Elusimicrobiota bacterium]